MDANMANNYHFGHNERNFNRAGTETRCFNPENPK
jgi:hypothetical protein